MRTGLKLKQASMIAALVPVLTGAVVAWVLLSAASTPLLAIAVGAGAGIVVSFGAASLVVSWVGGVIAMSRDSVARTAQDIAATVDQRQRLAAQQAAAANATTAAMEKLAASTSQ